MMPADDILTAVAHARDRLGPFALLRHLPEVASTNDVALALAAEGAPEGTSVLADVQLHGRGRRGHEWFSPAGAGLYLSVVLRPDPRASTLSLLTIAGGVAAAEAVQAATGLALELKWPNDLVIGRPWRKCGGLLAESTGRGGGIDAVVLGIGINLRPAAYPPALSDRATSIEAELGREVSRTSLVVELLTTLRTAVRALASQDPASVLAAWRARAHAAFGSPVRWRDQGEERRGIARDIDHDGALLVDREGRRERIIAGDLIWERLTRA